MEMNTNYNGEKKQIYKIYSIIEKPGDAKNIWLDIGVGSVNRDGSISCKLDCLPINGTIQLRQHDPREKQRRESYRRNTNNPPPSQWHEGGMSK